MIVFLNTIIKKFKSNVTYYAELKNTVERTKVVDVRYSSTKRVLFLFSLSFEYAHVVYV